VRFGVCVNPGVSVALLEALHLRGLVPQVVVTRVPTTPWRSHGIRGRLRALAVQSVAPVGDWIQPRALRDLSNTWWFCRQVGWATMDSGGLEDLDFVHRLRSLELDWLFVFGFGILPAQVLAVPLRGAIGFHPTLLPWGRGAAPMVASAMEGFPAAGFTVFGLEAGIDTGPVLLQEPVPVAPADDSDTHWHHVVRVGARRMASLVGSLVAGVPPPVGTPQSGADRRIRRPVPADVMLEPDHRWEEVARRLRAGAWLGGCPVAGQAGTVRAVDWVEDDPLVKAAPPGLQRYRLLPWTTADGRRGWLWLVGDC
jgi:methionyl-tRNA formyltransferase